MNTKCSVFIAASIDGFIAEADGGVDWLMKPEYEADDAGPFGYDAFIANVDAIVMGRNSFEKIITLAEWPYDLPVFVLSSGSMDIPAHLRSAVKTEGGEPGEIVPRLAIQGYHHLYIDGGVTVQHFLRARLINELTITRIPVLLGGGIPLFGSLGVRVDLRLLDTVTFDNGFVQVRYEAVYGR